MLAGQFAIARIKLDQSKYKKGYMYVSTVKDSDNRTSLDFRYFVDEDEVFIPTKIGFRISFVCLELCISKLLEYYKKIDATCCVSEVQKFRIRHLSDEQYGQSIDVRYYLTTDSYDGWSNKGIRFSINNYVELQKHIKKFLAEGLSTVNYRDLFQEKTISSKYPKKSSSQTCSCK